MEKDTALHLGVYSGGKQPLDSLLKYADERIGLDNCDIFLENKFRNTVLHEAAVSGNLEAVQILVDKFQKQVIAINESGETPLFRAAAFGKTKLVKLLASQPDQVVLPHNGKKKQLQAIHRLKKDGATILHAAVQGEHFGTALELLELDEELANLESCLPLRNDHNDDAENIEYKVEARIGHTITDGCLCKE
ncbi:hypothetical protein Ddye_014320 [Dipteronia dyeriana]|uniref:Ankyrin repeat protein n=1 Tax=Dipteronia dyeriana TaxID=168575 RepID=A0AAD9X7Y3_9ROSI|nr:hypothetical protein Ddye_014320 [Dipteronia dyeriana]